MRVCKISSRQVSAPRVDADGSLRFGRCVSGTIGYQGFTHVRGYEAAVDDVAFGTCSPWENTGNWRIQAERFLDASVQVGELSCDRGERNI